MLRVNKKIEYGVLALLHLAQHEEQTSCVRDIASHCQIPEPLLSKIMQTMKGSGLVAAVHGSRGGYRLGRALSAISLLDINNVLAGPVRVAECLDPQNTECPARLNCTLVTPMTVLNRKIISLFQSTSLDSLREVRP